MVNQQILLALVHKEIKKTLKWAHLPCSSSHYNKLREIHFVSMHDYRPHAFSAPLACCSVREFVTRDTKDFASAPFQHYSKKNAQQAQLRA